MGFLDRELQRIVAGRGALATREELRPRLLLGEIERVTGGANLEENGVQLQFRRTVEERAQLRLLRGLGQTRLRWPIQVVNRRHPGPAEFTPGGGSCR